MCVYEPTYVKNGVQRSHYERCEDPDCITSVYRNPQHGNNPTSDSDPDNSPEDADDSDAASDADSDSDGKSEAKSDSKSDSDEESEEESSSADN